MPQRDAYISEIRKYDNPLDKENSLYDVELPLTLIDAVIDPDTGSSLREWIETVNIGSGGGSGGKLILRREEFDYTGSNVFVLGYEHTIVFNLVIAKSNRVVIHATYTYEGDIVTVLSPLEIGDRVLFDTLDVGGAKLKHRRESFDYVGSDSFTLDYAPDVVFSLIVVKENMVVIHADYTYSDKTVTVGFPLETGDKVYFDTFVSMSESVDGKTYMIGAGGEELWYKFSINSNGGLRFTYGEV